ncbi:ATP-binding protein [uncultured Litoreibacter sp.]|uniref:ATP-binding protein n=1 Tax=uncultured Litoreibacter sp. TaxID=1392394 RepID=UPI0026291BF5|nr:ATP-binding protein [uncultured Litoreibacter sp.]
MTTNADTLGRELDWLSAHIERTITLHFDAAFDQSKLPDSAPPDLANDPSEYASFLKEGGFSDDERLVFILALAPLLKPEALDQFMIRNEALNRRFTEFGGTQTSQSGFRPTVETAIFLLAGSQLDRRLQLSTTFAEDSVLMRGRYLVLGNPEGGGFNDSPLSPGTALLDPLGSTFADQAASVLGFPAQRIETQLTWDDLILPAQTRHALDEILAWVKFESNITATSGPGRLIAPGYRSLFYGPPGTGKTLSASLLGQKTGRDVYRVDLSLIVSKWIGETEKNLARVFSEAENKGWILFFDEADALFGKRTAVSSSNDRHANQEVAFILQRIETFTGLVILASNLKSNIDPAFSRRFQSTIFFPEPGAAERHLLWSNAFGDSAWKGADIDIDVLAEKFELTGATIANSLRTAMLEAASTQRQALSMKDIEAAIRREFLKQDRVRRAEQ